MSYLGIDIGTTGCKALVINDKSEILSSAYREYPLVSPQAGFFELDPKMLLDKCEEVIAEAADLVKKTDPVKAIGISSQGEAFTLIDKSGQYLCNAMVSSDTRSQQQVKDFSESFGTVDLYQITGHSPHTLFSLFKLIWLKENRPETVSRANKFLCCCDLLCYHLTGESVTSHNLAARTMMFDVQHLCWSAKIMEEIDIDKAILPQSLPSGQAAGKLAAKTASRLGLDKEIIVTVGGHDQSCGALGVGITGAGSAAYSIGTVECISAVFDKCVLNETMRQANLATYPYTVDGLYTTVAFNITGGNLLRWFRDNFCQHELEKAKKTNSEVYDLILDDIPEEPTKIFVQPHFAATGTPYFDPNPTGAIIGLTLNSTRAELIKAILEGVTYEMKLNLELLQSAGITIDRIRACGGGAKSDKWLQIKADILALPIEALPTGEAGCLGAALLAGWAVGDIKSPDEKIRAGIKALRVFEPQSQNVIRYQELYEIYKQIYPTLKTLGKKLKIL